MMIMASSSANIIRRKRPTDKLSRGLAALAMCGVQHWKDRQPLQHDAKEHQVEAVQVRWNLAKPLDFIL